MTIQAVLPEPEPEGRYVRTARGLTFHYHETGTDTNLDRAPLVLLHGGGPGCTAWTDFGQVARLFARDRPCLLPDLLQYGRTDKPPITGPMWDAHAREYVGLLDALGYDTVDLVCNSWGGSAALNLAALYPNRVRRLVVTGSMPVLHGALSPLPERGARGRNARDAYYGGTGPSREKMRELMARHEWFDPDAIPDLTVDMRFAQSVTPGERAVNDDPARRGEWQDLSDRLDQVEAPTLLCWGMHDAFLTPDYPLMLASRLRRGSLYVMDRCAHHLQEERPTDFYLVVSAFLDLEVAR